MIEPLIFFLKQTQDYLFPIFCLGCGKEGEWVCAECFKKISLKGIFCCPVCHQENQIGVCCAECRNKSSLKHHFSACSYQEGELAAKILENFKYNFVEELSAVLKKMIEDFLLKNKFLFQEVKLIVPVPLHPKRFAERGFNQAQIIADILGSKLGIPVQKILKRKIYTKQQARLSREERIKNVENAFKIASSDLAFPILLVDDVFTTGSTMQECAKELLNCRKGKIVGFTMARG